MGEDEKMNKCINGVIVPMSEEEILEMQKEQTKGEKEYWQSINYAEAVNNEIRKRYSVSDEFAIIRQRDSKPEEFEAYNAYAEACKEAVKAEIEAEGI